MFLAMNRFHIKPGCESGFERTWRERETHLSEVEGFKAFSLLKETTEKDFILYISHSVWESQEAFKAWTKSDHFKRAHARTTKVPQGTYLGHPNLETFEVVL